MSWIVVYFESMGAPALGLSPLLRIRSVDDGSLVAEDTMEEVGGGFYRFDFIDYDITKDYIFLADAIHLLTKDRFVEGSTGEYGKITNNISIMSDNVGCRVLLMKKLDTNKLELYDGGNINWILYDDDSITPINTFNAQDKDGLYVLQMNYMASKRSKAIEHG